MPVRPFYDDPDEGTINKKKVVCKGCGAQLEKGQAAYYTGYRCPACVKVQRNRDAEYPKELQIAAKIADMIRADESNAAAENFLTSVNMRMFKTPGAYQIGGMAKLLYALDVGRKELGVKATYRYVRDLFDRFCLGGSRNY